MDEAATVGEVVVGVDGSAGARAALDWGLREARLGGRGLRLVTVEPGDGGAGASGDARVEDDLRARMHARLVQSAAGIGEPALHQLRAVSRGGRPPARDCISCRPVRW